MLLLKPGFVIISVITEKGGNENENLQLIKSPGFKLLGGTSVLV
jgi:hypothetical protein